MPKMTRISHIFLVSFLVHLYAAVQADMVVLEAVADNTIYQDNTSNSNGAGDFIFAGNNGGNSPRRALIRFDLSSIGANATIDQVTFTAFLSQGNAASVNVSLHRLTADWGESTSNAPGGEGGGDAAADGDATWLENFFGSSNWAVPGGDFVVNPSATMVIDETLGSYQWSSTGLRDDVASWLDGSQSNFGWILIGDESGPGTAKRFNSRDNVANSPFLTVHFTPVPEPGSALLLTVSMLVCGSKRRR